MEGSYFGYLSRRNMIECSTFLNPEGYSVN